MVWYCSGLDQLYDCTHLSLYTDYVLGYGDSEGTPTQERGPVSDAATLFSYVRTFAPTKPIFFWGGSLGTG